MKVTRTTTESKINVTVENGPVKKDYRAQINTPLVFLNHMVEHIVWRSGINFGVDVKLDKFDLAHVVAEDVGQTFGRAVKEYVAANSGEGLTGYGDGIGIIDEARSLCAISFENRALFVMDSDVEIPVEAEGMYSEDLVTFLDGFAQGANCTLQLKVERGVNAHHIWEAAFRAFGIALGRALQADPSRKGMTAGVAGQIDFTVEQ